jgi:hypothetical protein
MWLYILLGFFAGVAVLFIALFILIAWGSPDPRWEQSFARHKTLKAKGDIRGGSAVYLNPDGTVSDSWHADAMPISETHWEADGRDA